MKELVKKENVDHIIGYMRYILHQELARQSDMDKIFRYMFPLLISELSSILIKNNKGIVSEESQVLHLIASQIWNINEIASGK